MSVVYLSDIIILNLRQVYYYALHIRTLIFVYKTVLHNV